jgi:hypothetical protein
MLSPKATKLVAVTVGGGNCVRVTVNVHEVAAFTASVAVQVTFESPNGNTDPLGGVHDTFTGAVPPVDEGAG